MKRKGNNEQNTQKALKISSHSADPSLSDSFSITLLKIEDGSQAVSPMLRELMRLVQAHPVNDLDNLINDPKVEKSSFYQKMMSGVKILDASNVFEITQDYTIVLIAEIAAICSTLRTIKIHDNNFGVYGVKVAKALAKSLNLENVDFSYNELQEENSIKVINALLELPVLNTLYMIENIMTETDDERDKTFTAYCRDYEGEGRIQEIINAHNNKILEAVDLTENVMKEFVCKDVVNVILQYCNHPKVELVLSEYSDQEAFCLKIRNKNVDKIIRQGEISNDPLLGFLFFIDSCNVEVSGEYEHFT